MNSPLRLRAEIGFLPACSFFGMLKSGLEAHAKLFGKLRAG
jgi:hypothetical protein